MPVPEGLDEPYDAVILAGGLARRLGGADKPGAIVQGRALVAWVAEAVADAARLIVVGPERPELPRAIAVREDPPGSGPIPALRAGLTEVTAPWMALLAADLPYLRASHIALLREAAGPGAVLVDAGGREQWLAGFWRTDLVREALAGYSRSSMFGLLEPLAPVKVTAPEGEPWFDCDTPEDLKRARG